jgi:hypothetical protein
MGWKKLPSWTKGGIISIILIVILFFIILLLPIKCDKFQGGVTCGSPVALNWVGGSLTLLLYHPINIFYCIISIIIIGAIIGWIYGAIKNRRR